MRGAKVVVAKRRVGLACCDVGAAQRGHGVVAFDQGQVCVRRRRSLRDQSEYTASRTEVDHATRLPIARCQQRRKEEVLRTEAIAAGRLDERLGEGGHRGPYDLAVHPRDAPWPFQLRKVGAENALKLAAHWDVVFVAAEHVFGQPSELGGAVDRVEERGDAFDTLAEVHRL